MWGAALFAYIITVLHRTSFGVSGVAAAERYTVPPDQLSAFVFLQIAVYLAMQIPAGLLLDRWGSRALLAVGSFIMAAGQGMLAFSTSLPGALTARTIVGMGDALVFVAAIALLPRWFSGKRIPLLTQITAMTGQLGQILSAVPFLALLNGAGWAPAFSGAAALGVLAGVVVVVVVRNSPTGEWERAESMSASEIRQRLLEVWRRPGTRLSFFAHMGTHFSGIVFALMWGVPYLVQGQALTLRQASVLMSLFVVSSLLVGPVMGVLTSRHPLRRSWLVLAVIAATAVMWTVVLLQTEPAPMWLLVVLVVVLSAGPPGSVVGFDFARTANPSMSFGLAQSLVNSGGFLATLIVLQASRYSCFAVRSAGKWQSKGSSPVDSGS